MEYITRNQTINQLQLTVLKKILTDTHNHTKSKCVFNINILVNWELIKIQYSLLPGLLLFLNEGVYLRESGLYKREPIRSSHCGTAETNPTRNHGSCRLDPWPARWVNNRASPLLWCRSAAAAQIGPVAKEPPYALSAALKLKIKKNF